MSGTRLTRRQALKTLLAAGGGIAAAAFLPAKWLKPIVSAGVLPIHAATSAHHITDPYGGKGILRGNNVAVYIGDPTAITSILGIGIGAGAMSGALGSGPVIIPVPANTTPIPGISVSLNSITPLFGTGILSANVVHQDAFGGNFGTFTFPITVLTGNNAPPQSTGVADFGMFKLSDSAHAGNGSFSFSFSAEGCAPNPFLVTYTNVAPI